MTTATLDLTLADAGPLGVTIDDRGEGRPFLLLHGGGGPQTVAHFAELLATKEPARVITPTHPGFGGTRGRHAATLARRPPPSTQRTASRPRTAGPRA